MARLRHLDDQVLLDVNGLARSTGWLHPVLAGYATYGVVLFAILLVTAVLLARGRSARALAGAGWACLATLAAVAVNQPVGHLFEERRPYVTHPHLLVLASRTSDFSFPSDHAVMAGAAAAGLLLASRRLGLLAAAAAVLMAFSRVYIAAHYPWDVLAGLTLGAAVAVLGWLALRAPLTALTAYLRRQPAVRSVFSEQSARGTSGAPAELRPTVGTSG
jgi:membrane-associated phospholipid phosphatase